MKDIMGEEIYLIKCKFRAKKYALTLINTGISAIFIVKK